MKLQQLAENLIANLCNVDDVYYESKLNDDFIEGFDAFIRHSLRNYWSTNPQTDFNDI